MFTLQVLRLLLQDRGCMICRGRLRIRSIPKFRPHTRALTMVSAQLSPPRLQLTFFPRVNICYKTHTNPWDFNLPKIMEIHSVPFPSHRCPKCHRLVRNVDTLDEQHVTVLTVRKPSDLVLLELIYERRTFTVATYLVAVKFMEKHLILRHIYDGTRVSDLLSAIGYFVEKDSHVLTNFNATLGPIRAKKGSLAPSATNDS